MPLGITSTLLLGSLAFWWGIRFGRPLLRRGATANDLFRGNAAASLAFLGAYFVLLLVALYAPQWQWLPLEWRVYGMHVTWTVMRVTLLWICGVAFTISWHTARLQVLAVALLGVMGVGAFTSAEAYFLEPIYLSLEDNLRPNYVFQQTSPSSCAPAAMATLMYRWGIPATESMVARLAGTSRLGTSMPQLIVAARALNLDALEMTNTTWEQMQQVNRPGVLAVWLISRRGQRSPHAIALLKMTDEYAFVADPAWGRIYQLTRQQFESIWRKEYVPLFQLGDTLLTPSEVRDYLTRLGYLRHRNDNVTTAIRKFQRSLGAPATGDVDAETALMLSGAFISDAPTLTFR